MYAVNAAEIRREAMEAVQNAEAQGWASARWVTVRSILLEQRNKSRAEQANQIDPRQVAV